MFAQTTHVVVSNPTSILGGTPDTVNVFGFLQNQLRAVGVALSILKSMAYLCLQQLVVIGRLVINV